MDREAWWVTVRGVEKKSDMTKHTRIIFQSGWTNLYSQHQSVRIPVDLYSLK